MKRSAGEGIPIHQPEPEALDPEILIYPTVISGLAGDIYSLYAVEKGDFYLTTPLDLPLLDDEGEFKPLVLGREKVSKGIETSLFIVGADADTLYPYVRFDRDEGLLDAQGDVIEGRDRLLKLRETLLGMKERLHELVLRPAQTFERDAFMEEGLNGEIDRLEARLAELRALQAESGAETLPTRIGVRIVSGWEGEKTVDIEYFEAGASSLAEAIMRATSTFKEVNGRGDVQASEVQFTLKRGVANYNIPEEVWRPYYRTQATSEYAEEWAISYRQRDLAKETDKTAATD